MISLKNSTLAALSNLAVALLNVKNELLTDKDVLAVWDEDVGVEIDELPEMAAEIMKIVQDAEGRRTGQPESVIGIGDRVRVRTWDEILGKDGVDETWSRNALAVGKRYFSRAMGKFGNAVLTVYAVACDNDGIYYRLADVDGADVGFCFDKEMLERID